MVFASSHRRFRSCLLLASVLTLFACGRRGDGARAPEGDVSEIEANRYVRRAIRQSNEGWILLPSKRAERVYELPRLNEIAQGLRTPAAHCFLGRAIETMELRTTGERGYDHIPEGQLKARVRIAPSGEVLRAEVLESGFVDEEMEPCLRDVLEAQRWPPNKSGNSHYIDVIYWVSLGLQGAVGSPEIKVHMRREQIAAGRRAKNCLQGRVDAGRYEIGGLNLIDREGGTMVNRIDMVDLPQPIRACIATALREIRLPRDPDAFVRPMSPRVTFEVTQDGTVTVEGERWLALVELEERARRAAERAALEAERADDAEEIDPIDELPPRRPSSDGVASDGVAVVAEGPLELRAKDRPDESSPGERAPEEGTQPEPESRPALDPAKPGLRLELGARGGGGR